jgi:hypothetical protein
MLSGHFVEVSDVRNIAAKMGLIPGRHNKLDHVSVDILVENMQKEYGDDSPIFFYQPATPTSSFSIGVQTKSMRAAMEKFGPDAVCVDTTHQVGV